MAFATGFVLNHRYRIVKLLAQGGFGAIYRAWDLSLNRACAVKENLDTSSQAQQQFEREAKILANLNHPNLARVTDYFFVPGQGQYLVMDYVAGEDLQEMLDQAGGPLTEAQVLPWIGQVCDALEYLHGQPPPIIHRDIKPANIKITPQGKAMLVDFGIAKVYDPSKKTTMGARAVTPGYSPPEQYGSGSTDARSDVYALGATLYTLLTGLVPPQSVDIMTKVELPARPAIQLNPGIQLHTSAAIAHAMELDPVARFPCVEDFRDALLNTSHAAAVQSANQTAFGTVAVAPPLSQQPPGPGTASKRSSTQKILLGGAILTLLVLCTGGIAFLWWYGDAIFGSSPSQSPTLVSGNPVYEAPTSTFRPAITQTPSSSVLFFDDFSDPSSGWDRVNVKDGVSDYSSGHYRILVNTAKSDVWANPGLKFSDVRVDVYAEKVKGDDDNDFGVICRYQDNENFYFFVISSDGYYGIGKVVNGEQSSIGLDSMSPSPYIFKGSTTNHIRADCVGSQLSLYVNTYLLGEYEDTQFTSGDVGLLAGTFDKPGVEIYFDDFRVSQP